MSTDFKEVMSKRTDEELIKIVTVDREGYQPLAVVAAKEEIKNRKIDTVRIEQVETELKIEVEEKKQVDDKTVSSLIRFIHFILDSIVWLVVWFIVAVIVAIPFKSVEFATLIGYLLLIPTFIGYYYIMEVNYQKTLAKIGRAHV
jgi:hypothetical protein